MHKILLVILLCYISLYSQQLDDSWKLYDDSHTARIDITVNPEILNWIYHNVESDSEHYAVMHFKNSWIDETVDSIGFRLRGNTSRYSAKKSFKISFNTFIKGREFYGVDKLNLNGEHNDPSIIRSKLCFDHFKTIGLTASRANHVEVYINGNYYGLYISVEHIDDEFLEKNFADDSGNLWKCLYPADLVYLGSNPQLYIDLNINGRPAYELKTNEDIMDFTKLVRLITILNSTSSSILPDSLESIIDVPGVLKYFAMNILMGSWDDYWSLMNNYYLYHEPSKDIFHLIPYDYDNTYGIDWFNIDWASANPYNFPKVVGGYRPLAERLMDNAQYGNLYTHFLEFYRENVLMLHHWDAHIDSLRQMITPFVLQDTYRTLDWGFTIPDFYNSYSEFGYSNQHVKYGLKQFINARNESLPAQLSYLDAKPIVYQIDYEPKYPNPDDSIYVFASTFSNSGITEVSIYFIEEESFPMQIIPMNYSPVPNTKKVEEADRYIGVIPPLGAGKAGSFKIYVKDTQSQSMLYPRKDDVKIRTISPMENNVVINEFLADNSKSTPDPAGEYDDWIELYNPTSSPTLLTGRYMTDNPNNLTKWKITYDSLYINPGEYLVIWCDDNLDQPGIHATFKLSKSGEYIGLIDIDGKTIIDSITFGQQQTDISYGRYPDGSENWSFMFPTPGSGNIITSIEDKILPVDFKISAYPNPFNPEVNIQYTIPVNAEVKIKIYDLLGKEIWTKEEGYKTPGSYKLRWNGVNINQTTVSTGVYILRVFANEKILSYKLMMLK